MDIAPLKKFIPLNALSNESLQSLADQTQLETLAKGSQLFKLGDQDTHSIYLLSGEVSLLSSNSHLNHSITAGSDDARYALAQLKPRQYTGVTKTEVSVVRLDSAFIDRLLTVDQTAAAGFEVIEFDGTLDPEWMIRMLCSAAFQKLPPANINELFIRLEPLAVASGQVIIRQGDPGDYYYLIKSGQVNVFRKTGGTGTDELLGQLGEGDSFGEEALLSGAPRNATVVMASDGVLMRLAKKDFDHLLKEPLVRWVNLNEVKIMTKTGAVLLDVRLEDEHRKRSIKGSVNVPLYRLRKELPSFDNGCKYIIFCETGSRSCAAAFLLSQRGFDVYVLRGGLNAFARTAI